MASLGNMTVHITLDAESQALLERVERANADKDAIAARIAQAVAEEREACAGIADRWNGGVGASTAEKIAAVIRVRGKNA